MSSKTSSGVAVRFFGGVEGDIGGNIVFFTKKKTGYFFDFGLELTKSRIKDRLGYTDEQIYQFELAPFLTPLRKELNEIRVFISHGHIDHWKALTILPKELKRELVLYLPSYTYYSLRSPLKEYTSLIHMRVDCSNPKATAYSDDNIEVVAFPVDHSIPGACCFILEVKDTNDTFLYTGDFRTHGSLSQVINQQFWDYLQGTPIKAVICEGTEFGKPSERYCEAEVGNKVKEIVEANRDNIVFVVVSTINDLFRLHTLSRCGTEKLREPFITDNFQQSISTLKAFMGEKNEAIVSLLESINLRDLPNIPCIPSNGAQRINLLRQIKSNPSGYLIITTLRPLFKLLGDLGEASRGGCCILSLSEFFEEAAGVRMTEVTSTLSEAGLIPFRAHSAGHAYSDEVAKMLRSLKSEKIFVMHSNYPEDFAKFLKARGIGADIICPKRNQVYEF